MDQCYWTTAEQRAALATGPRLSERQGTTAERGRDRTSQSKLSWSLTITSHFPPPHAVYFLMLASSLSGHTRLLLRLYLGVVLSGLCCTALIKVDPSTQ